jgi:hypothetical protein
MVCTLSLCMCACDLNVPFMLYCYSHIFAGAFFWNGGFLANNPVLIALAEVNQASPSGINCVVSLGCRRVENKISATYIDSFSTIVSTQLHSFSQQQMEGVRREC